MEKINILYLKLLEYKKPQRHDSYLLKKFKNDYINYLDALHNKYVAIKDEKILGVISNFEFLSLNDPVRLEDKSIEFSRTLVRPSDSLHVGSAFPNCGYDLMISGKYGLKIWKTSRNFSFMHNELGGNNYYYRGTAIITKRFFNKNNRLQMYTEDRKPVTLVDYKKLSKLVTIPSNVYKYKEINRMVGNLYNMYNKMGNLRDLINWRGHLSDYLSRGTNTGYISKDNINITDTVEFLVEKNELLIKYLQRCKRLTNKTKDYNKRIDEMCAGSKFLLTSAYKN